MNRKRLKFLLLPFLAACAKDPDFVPDEDLAPPPADMAVPPGMDMAPKPDCRTLAPADRLRRVVISLPYDDDANRAEVYGVLPLAEDGTLGAVAARFQMGRAFGGPIRFTPDGSLGFVAQEDGSVGVFRLSPDGTPQVIEAHYTAGGYTTRVVMDPSGDRLYFLNGNTRDNGGGITQVRVSCEGTLTPAGELAAGSLPYALLPLGDGTAVAYAREMLDSSAGDNTHLLKAGPPMTRQASAQAFGDGDAIVASSGLTVDHRYALFGDNSEFTGPGNRVAVVAVEQGSLRPVQVLSAVQDPVSMVLSPFGNAGLFVSGYGNAVLPFGYDAANTKEPIALLPQPTYEGKRPQLPDTAVGIERGKLKGWVLLSENTGVRRMAFAADGSLRDLGVLNTGDKLSDIVGAIGVQP